MTLREEFGDHPGIAGLLCPIQVRVIARGSGESMSGYACGYTGGHCITGEYCSNRRAETAATDKLIASLTEAKADD